MVYVFRDLPADSSELLSYGVHSVARAPQQAGGGPLEPETGGLLLPLDGPRFVPVPQAFERRWGRTVPVRHWHDQPLVPNTLLAAFLWVPALCGAAVWAIGMMRW